MTFTLEHPVGAPTDTVVLRNPNIGDEQNIDFGTLIRRTRLGYLNTHIQATWPKIEFFRYDFDVLTEAEIDELRTFIRDHAGQSIRVIEHNAVTRDGHITNEEIEKIPNRDACDYSTQLTLMVVT